MKKIILLLSLLATVANAQSAGEQTSGFKFGINAGYQFLDLGYSFSHSTHPGDRSFLKGSPGTTEISDVHLGRIGLGGEFQSGKLSFNLEGALLLGGDARTEHKNNNDPRPAASAANVYSQVGLGYTAGLGVDYRLTRLVSIGAVAEVAGLEIESGWDRFGADEVEQESFEHSFGGGPRLMLHLGENTRIEAVGVFGDWTGFRVGLRFAF